MSTPAPGNSEAKSHAQQHTDSTKKSVPGWEQTYNALVSTPLSQHSYPLCQPGIMERSEETKSILCELNSNKFKKRPSFSAEMIHYSLELRYKLTIYCFENFACRLSPP